MLKKWHFYKAHTLTSTNNELTKKIGAIEKAIVGLDDVDKTILELKYFQCVEVDIIKSKVYLSRSVIYWRIDKAVKEISYFILNSV